MFNKSKKYVWEKIKIFEKKLETVLNLSRICEITSIGSS